MDYAILTTENLTKNYKSAPALRGVSLTVRKGDIYGLVGRNGAGKTTLFKLIMGAIKKNGGKITIDNSEKLSTARQNVGFMIGTPFFPYLNAQQNLEYYRQLKGIKDKNEIKRVLTLVDLAKVKKPFKAYSLGMKQRLGIANALLGQPAIVILDEPVNGLDPQGINDIRMMIKDLNERCGTTFIISTHLLSELDLVANAYGFIDEGVLLKQMSKQELHWQANPSLVVKTNDAQKALSLVKEKLNYQELTLVDNQKIVIKEAESAPEQVARVIIQAGLKLYSLHKEKTSLEDYYFSIIGGKAHA